MFQLNPTFKGKKNCLGKVVQVDDYSIYADLRKKKLVKIMENPLFKIWKILF